MIDVCYTSPSDQAMRTLDVAFQSGEHTDDERALLTEATRWVMDLALLSPATEPKTLAQQAYSSFGSPTTLTLKSLEQDAYRAKVLIEKGALVSDEEFVHKVVENGLERPTVRQ